MDEIQKEDHSAVKVVLTFELLDEILKCDIELKSTERILFGGAYYAVSRVALTFDSLDTKS